MRYLQNNKNYSQLDSECRGLIIMAVNRLGDCGIFIDGDNVHHVAEDHAQDCVTRSVEFLSDKGVEVSNRINEIMGW